MHRKCLECYSANRVLFPSGEGMPSSKHCLAYRRLPDKRTNFLPMNQNVQLDLCLAKMSRSSSLNATKLHKTLQAPWKWGCVASAGSPWFHVDLNTSSIVLMRPSNRSIYIGDLADTVTEHDLHSVFSKAGPIQSVVCCRDSASGKFLNYGFVNFTTPEAARTAQVAMKHVLVCGKQARVMPSLRHASERKLGIGNLYVKNLHPCVSDDSMLHSYFASCGVVLSAKIAKDAKGNSKGFGFVQYETAEDADNAIRELDGTSFAGQLVSVSHFVPSKPSKVRTAKQIASPSSQARPATAPNRIAGEANLDDVTANFGSLKAHQGSKSEAASPLAQRLVSVFAEDRAPKERSSRPKGQTAEFFFLPNQAMLAKIERLRAQSDEKNKAAEQMLVEFKRLGKVQESNVKRPLQKIMSFSLIADGFQENKEQIVQLCEDALNAVRGGAPSAKDLATTMLNMLHGEESSWKNVGPPTMVQVMQAFASGRDSEAFVELPVGLLGKRRRISLRRASQCHHNVTVCCYLTCAKAVQAQLISALSSDPVIASQAQQTIENFISILVALLTAWVMGQSTSFSAIRAIKTGPISLQAEAICQVLTDLPSNIRAKLWQHWDKFCSVAPGLMESVKVSEQNFDNCLANLDKKNEDASLLSTLEAVMDLMDRYYEVFEEVFLFDTRCGWSLSLLQFGILVVLYLPDIPLEQLIIADFDPYIRFATLFTSGFIPKN